MHLVHEWVGYIIVEPKQCETPLRHTKYFLWSLASAINMD